MARKSAASPSADELRAVLERAFRQVVSGQSTVDVAIAAVLAEVEEQSLSVTTKQREKAEGDRLLARYDELIARGHAHKAAMIVAREFGQPHEWETIADRVRRLRARRKKCAA
jgi:hypothetical protein